MTQKKNVGLRLDPPTRQRVTTFLEKLRTEPGWSGASDRDAMRVLIDKGLKIAEERAKTAK